MPRNIHTLSETIHLATQLEQTHNSVAPINYLRNENKGFIEKNDKFEKKENFSQNTKKEHGYLKQSQNRSNDNKDEIICRRCKKKGQYANKCYANLNK
ncbi:unnamed protein product, partial [Brachionus calyciflorus]